MAPAPTWFPAGATLAPHFVARFGAEWNSPGSNKLRFFNPLEGRARLRNPSFANSRAQHSEFPEAACPWQVKFS
jgi:hypothetical protein